MSRGWRKAGTSLALAGWLGSGFAFAGEPVRIDQATGLPVFEPGQPARSIVLVEAWRARAWIVDVELALLADPVTHPYALRAQAGQDGLELRGYVPNAMVKERALAAARRHCSIPVVDNLTVEPRMSTNVPRPPSPTLAEDARRRLTAALPEAAPHVGIAASVTGIVTLTGMPATPEQKLACSRALRGLPGCTGVVNEMSVRDNPLAKRQTNQPVKEVSQAKAVDARPVLAKSEPPRAALAGVVVADNGEPPTKPTPPQAMEPRTLVAAEKPPASSSSVQPVAAREVPATSRASIMPPEAADATPPPAPPAPSTAPSIKETAEAVRAATATAPPAPIPSTGAKSVAAQPIAKASSSTTPPPARPLPSEPARTGLATPYAQMTADYTPMTPLPQRRTWWQRGREHSFVAAGGNAAPPPRAALPPASSGAAHQELVKSRIEGILGGTARRVEVRLDDKGGANVTVSVAGQGDPKLMAQQILQVQELAAYDVKIEFRID